MGRTRGEGEQGVEAAGVGGGSVLLAVAFGSGGQIAPHPQPPTMGRRWRRKYSRALQCLAGDAGAQPKMGAPWLVSFLSFGGEVNPQ